mmetsp:Transcript_13869/g.27652  ORF Transcript_13869/g.27652 Transcript_13869/m.27652 type:complete len:259 (+) Transcript_13869:103-879(+)
MEDSQKSLIWMGGCPTTGKTFTGDYLATRGWHHIDGDGALQSPDPDVRGLFLKLNECFEFVLKGEEAPKEKYMPYFEHLAKQIREAQKEHDKVVCTFAIMNMFGPEFEMLKSEFPSMMFIKLCSDLDVMVERWLERNTRIFEAAGTSMKEAWAGTMNDPYRKTYGEEYSDDAYRAQAKGLVFAVDWVRIPDEPENKCYNFWNNDHAGNQAIKDINKLLGLEDIEIDPKAIEAVNMARMKNVDVKAFEAQAKEMKEAKE